MFDVVSVVAVEFAESLGDEVDRLADSPGSLAIVADPSGGRSVAYAFRWYSYVVTIVVRVSDRMGLLYVDRVTIRGAVAGINLYD